MNIDFDKSKPAMDMQAKREMYDGFVHFSITAIVALAIMLILMAYFLV